MRNRTGRRTPGLHSLGRCTQCPHVRRPEARTSDTRMDRRKLTCKSWGTSDQRACPALGLRVSRPFSGRAPRFQYLRLQNENDLLEIQSEGVARWTQPDRGGERLRGMLAPSIYA